MRAETLHRITLEIFRDIEDTGIEVSLPNLIEGLQAHSSSPTEATQERIVELRQSISEALSRSRFNAAPTRDQELLEKMGIANLLGDRLLERIDDAFVGNHLTPAPVIKKLAAMNETFQALYTSADAITDSLAYFEIEVESLNAGEFEVVVAIPCSAVDNELQQFGKEALNVNRLLSVFSEIATGSRDPVKIKAISSSDLSLFLDSAPAVAALVATCLERLATLYEKILGVIKLHREMKAIEIPESVLDPLKKHIEKEVGAGIEKIAKAVEKEQFGKIETARRQELKTELRNSLREIASRLDRGYGFDVKGADVAPPKEPGGEAAEAKTPGQEAISAAYKTVSEARPRIKHFQSEQEPILGLPAPSNDS